MFLLSCLRFSLYIWCIYKNVCIFVGIYSKCTLEWTLKVQCRKKLGEVSLTKYMVRSMSACSMQIWYQPQPHLHFFFRSTPCILKFSVCIQCIQYQWNLIYVALVSLVVWNWQDGKGYHYIKRKCYPKIRNLYSPVWVSKLAWLSFSMEHKRIYL